MIHCFRDCCSLDVTHASPQMCKSLRVPTWCSRASRAFSTTSLTLRCPWHTLSRARGSIMWQHARRNVSVHTEGTVVFCLSLGAAPREFCSFCVLNRCLHSASALACMSRDSGVVSVWSSRLALNRVQPLCPCRAASSFLPASNSVRRLQVSAVAMADAWIWVRSLLWSPDDGVCAFFEQDTGGELDRVCSSCFLRVTSSS